MSKSYFRKLINCNVLIILDNINIGGIQRLALDEAYALSDRNVATAILVLSPDSENDSFIKQEYEFLKIYEFNILFCDVKMFRKLIQIFYCVKYLRRDTLIISHSLSGTLLLRLIGILKLKKFKIFTWLHQVISFSKGVQKYKRVVYSLCSTKIFFGSPEFLSEWIEYPLSKFSMIIKGKHNYQFQRCGLYVERITWQGWKQYALEVPDKKKATLVYASRITFWKGFNTFKEICNSSDFTEINKIIITNYNNKIEINPKSVITLFDSGPYNLRNVEDLVHIYPAQYGSNVKYPAHVGTNVLEFLVMGIPSIITQDNLDSFPSLRKNRLLLFSNWRDITEVLSLINVALNLNDKQRLFYADLAKPHISNESHINFIIDQIN